MPIKIVTLADKDYFGYVKGLCASARENFPEAHGLIYGRLCKAILWQRKLVGILAAHKILFLRIFLCKRASDIKINAKLRKAEPQVHRES